MKKLLILLFSIIIASPLYSYSYEDLVSSMEMNNEEVLKSIKSHEVASLDVLDAKAGYQPEISTQLIASHLFNPMDPISINTSDYSPAVPSQVIEVFPGQENSYYKASITMTQPLFTWLKITDAVDIYENLEQIAAINMNDVERKLVSELNTRLTMDLYLTKILNKFEEQIKISDELVQISKQSKEVGVLTDLDIMKIELDISKLKLEKTKILSDKEFNMANIRKMVGIDDLTSDNLEYNIDYELYETLSTQDRQELKDRAISGTQDSIRMLNLSNNVLQEQKSIAQNSMYWKPDFALVVNLDYAGSRIPFVETDWYGQDDYSGNVTVAVKTTLWDGGKKINNLKRADSELESNVLERQSAVDTILITLDEQFASIDKALANSEYLQLKKAYYIEKIALENEKLAIGASDKTTILQLELESSINDLALLQEEIALVSAYYLIDYLCN